MLSRFKPSTKTPSGELYARMIKACDRLDRFKACSVAIRWAKWMAKK